MSGDVEDVFLQCGDTDGVMSGDVENVFYNAVTPMAS